MPQKLLFFINPISGTGGKVSLKKKIEEKCRKYQTDFEIASTTADGNYPGLKEKVLKEQVTGIVICGGDGSLSPLIYELLETEISFGIIPLGSGNGLALTAKIPMDTELALELIFNGKAKKTDAFLINSRLSCMLSGIGFDAQVAYDFSLQKQRGFYTYMVQTLKNLVTATAYPFTVEVQGQKLKTEAFFICIANSNQFGNNFTIAPEANLSDGLFDIIVVKKMAKMKMVWSVMQQMSEGKVTESVEEEFYQKNLFYMQADSVVIHNKKLAPLHIDGDPAESADKFDIRILPGAFRLIQP
jgi:YegS/Rv2252/BmrU family lipid kinase